LGDFWAILGKTEKEAFYLQNHRVKPKQAVFLGYLGEMHSRARNGEEARGTTRQRYCYTYIIHLLFIRIVSNHYLDYRDG
jgi:hypothetical protein